MVKKDRRPAHSVSKKEMSEKAKPNNVKSSVSQNELKEAFLWALEEHDKRKLASEQQSQQKTPQEMKLKQKVMFVIKMPFVKSEDIQGNETMVMFMSFVFSAIFSFMRLFFILISVASFIIPIVFFATRGITWFTITVMLLCCAFLFASYVFAGVFRRMSIEAENIKNENYAIALFSAMGTLVSFIVALITLVSQYW